VQVAQVMKITPRNVRIKVTARYFREGSVLQGTARVTCDSVHTDLSLDSDEPPERIAHLIRMAEASCFTMAALRNNTPCELASTVNGQPFDILAAT
jgi:hypothetical protein